VAIARAISSSPSLIVLDEPMASLDVSIRGQIANLLMDLRQAMSLTYVLISHEFSTTRHLSDDIEVMYAGKVMERGPSTEVYADPRHPYTQLLVTSAELGDSSRPGYPAPKAIDTEFVESRGCPFRLRCPFAMPVCDTTEPLLQRSAGRVVACHLYEADEPADVSGSAGDDPDAVEADGRNTAGTSPGRRGEPSNRPKYRRLRSSEGGGS
jgi:oligopeptide/dipeptide ABC transporter ATP-binding protein